MIVELRVKRQGVKPSEVWNNNMYPIVASVAFLVLERRELEVVTLCIRHFRTSRNEVLRRAGIRWRELTVVL
jgi:hypothetical protein